MIPTVAARLVLLPPRGCGDGQVAYLTFHCLWCGRDHHHGAGADLAHPAYGHRASHCTAPSAPAGYVLVPEGSGVRVIGLSPTPSSWRRAGGDGGAQEAPTGDFRTRVEGSTP